MSNQLKALGMAAVLCLVMAFTPIAAWGASSYLSLDAAVEWDNGKAYFFCGKHYIRYDIKADCADPGYPRPVDDSTWKGLSFNKIDAAVNWGNGKAYFFSDNMYIRYDIKADCADPGYPKPLNSNWNILSFNQIDAAVNWGNGKAYFFYGNMYIQYDIKNDKPDPGYPQPIARLGLSFKRIDAAVNWGNGKIYFFSGNQYTRFDIKANRPDAGYPKTVDNNTWKGLSFDIAAAKRLANWMSRVNDAKLLSDLSIPGTHESCSLYGSRDKKIPGTNIDMPPFAKCQNMDLFAQLTNGVRFIDIRCFLNNKNEFTIFHGSVYQNLNFENVLKTCYDFLNYYPQECIIMSVDKEGADNPIDSFEQPFINYINKHPEKWFLENRIPSLNEVRGKIVLYRCFPIDKPKPYDEPNWIKKLKNMGIDMDHDYKSNSVNKISNFYDNFISIIEIQDIYDYSASSNDMLKKWNAIESFFGKTHGRNLNTLYINFTSAVGGKSISYPDITNKLKITTKIIPNPSLMAAYINPKVRQYIYDNSVNNLHWGIVAMDFTQPDINSLIIDANM